MKPYVLRPWVPGAGLKSRQGEAGKAVPSAPAPAQLVGRGLSKVHIPPSVPQTAGDGGEVVLYRGASLLKLSGDGVNGAEAPECKRGRVEEFSDAARRRLMQLLAMVRRDAVPLFVTLTYPDAFPKDFAVFKGHLEAFGKRVRRRWPDAALVWRLEFQPRKSGQSRGQVAPHFHLFVYGVPWEFAPQVERGASYSFKPQGAPLKDGGVLWETSVTESSGAVHHEFRTCFERDGEGLDKFMFWCSRNWFDVVGSGDVKHYRAGTRVELIRSAGAVFAYAAKRYLCKPEETPKLDGSPGRFWGVIGRRSLPMGKRERVKLTAREVVQLRRLVRRYRRANTKPERRKWLKRGASVLFCNVEVWIEKLDLLGRGGSVATVAGTAEAADFNRKGQPG